MVLQKEIGMFIVFHHMIHVLTLDPTCVYFPYYTRYFIGHNAPTTGHYRLPPACEDSRHSINENAPTISGYNIHVYCRIKEKDDLMI